MRLELRIGHLVQVLIGTRIGPFRAETKAPKAGYVRWVSQWGAQVIGGIKFVGEEQASWNIRPSLHFCKIQYSKGATALLVLCLSQGR